MARPEKSQERPLEGLLVVSVEQAVAAPTCTVRLADAGARVIKVERAGGETARHYDRAVHGISGYFAWLNRGKESAVLDLKAAADLALLGRMVARADVFVQNLAPGASARLGFGAAELVARHPRLIALDIVGYGQDTAYRDMKAYDLLVQAESGICAVTGTPEVPAKVGVSIADVGTGMTAHAAVLEALIARGISGRGRAIEIAMFDVMADWMTVPTLYWEMQGRDTPRCGLSHAIIFPYGAVDCLDGQVCVAVQAREEWPRFCDGVLQRPELATDPRFHDNPARVENRAALQAVMDGVFGGLTRAEAIARLDLAGLPYGSVSTVADMPAHPARRRIDVPLPAGAPAEGFSCTAPPLHPKLEPGPLPALGEHTDRIRAEFAA
ncbi:MAG: CaiB/BaiF CoA-transferase family protein [Sneathiellaceae bacterium]